MDDVTIQEAANNLCVSTQTIRTVIKSFGVKTVRHKTTVNFKDLKEAYVKHKLGLGEKSNLRKKKARALRNEGLNFREIGKLLGVSRQRAHQICQQEKEAVANDGD